jgi:hypothetical protein
MPSFLASLSDAFGEAVEMHELLSLPETDSLLATFREGYQAVTDGGVSYRRFFLSNEKTRVYRIADCLGKKLSAEKSFFLAKLSNVCGAVLVSASTLLERAESIIQFDGDSVCAVSSDREQGFLIDRNPDDPQRAYELSVWGERWARLIRACDQSRNGDN